MSIQGMKKQGLYDPRFEHDACGVGFVANINGSRTHEIVTNGIQVLINLTHRGATGGDNNTGDGAGILLHIPHEFFASKEAGLSFELPSEGEYGVGMVFLPLDDKLRSKAVDLIEKTIKKSEHTILGWREVPFSDAEIGRLARESEPHISQLFVSAAGLSGDKLESSLYVLRKLMEKAFLENGSTAYLCSLSSRTIVYKGLLLAHQITGFYPDLNNKLFKSGIALVHQRYSTNTFPTWELAQPFRYMAHNGEINTLRGNINMMKAREGVMKSNVFGEDLEKLYPVIQDGFSDSAMFDNALEFLVRNGREMPHALMMMVPEAWGEKYHIGPDLKGFFEYNSIIMEPWDGPASISFTDGKVVGAVMDRNGLRPARYTVTKDGFIVLASETGVLDIEPSNVEKKGIVSPGKMILVDTEADRVIFNDEIKSVISRKYPFRRWVEENRVDLKGLFESPESADPDIESLVNRQVCYGYSHEEIKMVLRPMSEMGKEAVGSMGADNPLAVLSERPQLLYNYFKQLFAQVTNPPIDPIREELVMSVMSFIGRGRNLLEDTPRHCNKLKLKQPVLTNAELEKIRNADPNMFKSITIDATFEVSMGEAGIRDSFRSICEEAEKAVKEKYDCIILSDRNVSEDRAPIPSLLALGLVESFLSEKRRAAEISVIIESGEAREVMHYALLLGYGASAVNPYLALETIVSEDVLQQGLSPENATENYIHAVEKGLKKTFSRMGISTLRSYRGAQIFEAIGLSSEFINEFFPGTPARIEGIGLAEVVEETLARHRKAFDAGPEGPELESGGFYHFRKNGERHLWTPEAITLLQQSTRGDNYEQYKEYAKRINDQTKALSTLRGLFSFKKGGKSVSIDDVEPEENIMKRFVTGAMSFGSISKEAHETLAIAMNSIGGMSNTGEGGEDPERFIVEEGKPNRRSAIKQVASGRFGVTSNYLANSDEIQIKMAQGAKPGEGGQLPGHKVNEVIAKVRHSTPGVTLISPPPHHDIYSIEDLAQLIFDLKNSNPDARISVKLVSEVGVGTIAAGVSKAHADMVLISGYDGGTGASPLTSIKHAGLPWELGLAETQQTLVANELRDRIRVQVDGQMKTGRDVAVAILLGAEEFGFATAPLVVCGCVMMRKCHKNTCPVGVATQDPELRKRFTGKPEYLVNFFRFIARELREIMAELGFKTVDEMVGQIDCLEKNKAVDFWKARNLDFSNIFYFPEGCKDKPIRRVTSQDHGIDDILDRKLLEEAEPVLSGKKKNVTIETGIRNTDRTATTMLSSAISRKFGEDGLPDDSVHINFSGVAGQSFGAFLAKGVTAELVGESNDYTGKGLSGGRMIVRPPEDASFRDDENAIIGNVSLYGATDGEAYFRGLAGERFAIRNSGCYTVVEGIGFHGCEYMTGGRVVVLGKTGLNFGAGMSGGLAFVLDEDGMFDQRCNLDMVDLDLLELEEDVELVKNMISNHVKYTGSPKGKMILDDWRNYQSRFIKVFPMEYRRILGQMIQDDVNTKREVPQNV